MADNRGSLRVGITDLPTEVIHCVVDRLDRIADVSACCRALCLPFSAIVSRRDSLCPMVLLKAGAPLCVVRPFIERRQPRDNTGSAIIPFEYLEAAIRGGRVGVIAWLHKAASADTVRGLTTWAGVANRGGCALYDFMRSVMSVAVENNRHQALRWLLDYYGRASFCQKPVVGRNIIHHLFFLAISTPSATTDILDALHSPYTKRGGKKCGCGSDTFVRAAELGRTDVLAWLNESTCTARFGMRIQSVAQHAFARAVECGHTDAARWIAETAHRPHLERVRLDRAIRDAAIYGEVDILDLVCGLGLWTFSVDVLTDAAAYGSIDVLVWATNTLTVSSEPGPRTIARWPFKSMAYLAYLYTSVDAIEWLLGRDDLDAVYNGIREVEEEDEDSRDYCPREVIKARIRDAAPGSYPLVRSFFCDRPHTAVLPADG